MSEKESFAVRWQKLPHRDADEAKEALILEALAARGGHAWASDLAKDLDITTQTVRRILYSLNYRGVLQWFAYSPGPVLLQSWEGVEAAKRRIHKYPELEKAVKTMIEERFGPKKNGSDD